MIVVEVIILPNDLVIREWDNDKMEGGSPQNERRADKGSCIQGRNKLLRFAFEKKLLFVKNKNLKNFPKVDLS